MPSSVFVQIVQKKQIKKAATHRYCFFLIAVLKFDSVPLYNL